MLNLKIKRLQTRNAYTLEELFDAIKEVTFTAGRPRLTHDAFTPVIVFPALDMDNQVRVYNAGLRSKSNKFYVQKDVCAGSLVDQTALDDLTDGWLGMGFSSGNTAKLCDQLTERTYQELDRLEL